LSEFGRGRQRYYEVCHQYDNWYSLLRAEEGEEADRRRERYARAKDADPTLCGYATIEERGPDGLPVGEDARRHYFGEDLD